MKLALTLLSVALCANSLLAQSDILPGSGAEPPCGPGTTSTILYRTVLRPSNVVPPVSGLTASAGVTIRVHTTTSPGPNAIDFVANYNFGGPVTITGLQIRSGAAGQNGAVLLDSGISAAAPVQSQTGSGTINIQLADPADNKPTGTVTSAAKQFAGDPTQFYVEIDTTANPAGALRGQLAVAQQSVAMALMSPFNETAILGGAATGTGTVVATITRGASGAISSAEVVLDLNYQFPSVATMTALQVQQGAERTDGPAVIHIDLGNIVVAIGSGNVRQVLEADVTNPAVVAMLEALFIDPSNYYLNLLTNANPTGAMRGQLLRASRSDIQSTMCVGTATGQNLAGAKVTVDVLRSSTGDLQAGLVTYDIDYQVPPNTMLVSAGISGVLTGLSTANPLTSTTGAGNVYELVSVSSFVGLQQLGQILAGNRQTLNLVTSTQVNISGTVPLFSVSGTLQITSIQNGSGDSSAETAAPGGLISLFGNFPGGLPDFANVDVTGLFNRAWPTSLNGTWVTIGDRNIPLGFHSLTQIDAQIPPDLPPGPYQVRYWASRDLPSLFVLPEDQPDYRSDPYILTVSAQAPGIFVSAAGPAITHASTGAAVSATAPAAAGETLYVYATGIAGQPTVTATIGGATATASLVAVPYILPGVEIYTLTVPAGLSGSQTLTLTAGGTVSNSVPLALQ
ncbi:MAG: CHRD domain-containing protein [Candidatus Sulfopaludibacter sp.]|nr:CHRD domain-containing protein [Candidatus Sulfopaludibacter sp.]